MEKTNTNATLIHLEDRPYWHTEVEQAVFRLSRCNFKKYHKINSVDQLRDLLGSIKDTVVIILDFKLLEKEQDFSGFDWLKTEMSPFRATKARVLIYIISGHLQERFLSHITSLSISEKNVVRKSEWADKRGFLIADMDQKIIGIEKIARVNIENNLSGHQIDSYLLHKFQEKEEVIDTSQSQVKKPADLLPMIIKTKNSDWDFNKIPDLKLITRINTFFTCLGSIDSVVELENDPEVMSVEASRPGDKPSLHESVNYVKAEKIHKEREELGDQSIIGIIDTGIDFLHKSFLDIEGNTRILSIWDQTDSSGTPPESQVFGTEHDSKTIQEYIDKKHFPKGLKVKKNDHGTHVASIAAGSYVNNYSGIAPEAKIIVVKTQSHHGSNSEENKITINENEITGHSSYSVSVMSAIDYLLKEAKKIQLPMVINICQGVNCGSHDGTSNIEQAIDELTSNGAEKGLMVVKSAGNERDKQSHTFLKDLKKHKDYEITWRSEKKHLSNDIIEIWYSSGDNYKFQITDPQGTKSGWTGIENLNEEGIFNSSKNKYRMTLTPVSPGNNDSKLIVRISSGNSNFISTGDWKLRVKCVHVQKGEIHAWIERTHDHAIRFKNCDENYTISIPGTSKHVLTVGSIKTREKELLADFISKDDIRSERDASAGTAASKSLPKLSEFSSLGPTRDGRKKPELSAPGEFISAANSGGQSDDVISNSGTSMAAPHVSGVVALLFSAWQKKKEKTKDWEQLSSNDIMDLLKEKVFKPENWDSGKGYGILDAEKIFNELKH